MEQGVCAQDSSVGTPGTPGAPGGTPGTPGAPAVPNPPAVDCGDIGEVPCEDTGCERGIEAAGLCVEGCGDPVWRCCDADDSGRRCRSLSLTCLPQEGVDVRGLPFSEACVRCGGLGEPVCEEPGATPCEAPYVPVDGICVEEEVMEDGCGDFGEVPCAGVLLCLCKLGCDPVSLEPSRSLIKRTQTKPRARLEMACGCGVRAVCRRYKLKNNTLKAVAVWCALQTKVCSFGCTFFLMTPSLCESDSGSNPQDSEQLCRHRLRRGWSRSCSPQCRWLQRRHLRGQLRRDQHAVLRCHRRRLALRPARLCLH